MHALSNTQFNKLFASTYPLSILLLQSVESTSFKCGEKS